MLVVLYLQWGSVDFVLCCVLPGSFQFFPHLYSRLCYGFFLIYIVNILWSWKIDKRFFCSFCDFINLPEGIVHFLDIRKPGLPDSISCFYYSFSNGRKKACFCRACGWGYQFFDKLFCACSFFIFCSNVSVVVH